MKITTKTGDQGSTDVRNQRLEKDHPLIGTLGLIDEVMASFIYAQANYPEKLDEFKDRVQELVLMSAIIAGYKTIDAFKQEFITNLETTIDAVQHLDLDWYYPFNDVYRATLNVLRTQVRKMERSLIATFKETTDYPIIRIYVNRLSDYIFALMNKV